MRLIVAVDQNWGIGCNGGLLFSIPEDMKLFRQITAGKVVVMGRHTLESLPNAKPLGNRINIVLSSNNKLEINNVLVCGSVDELLRTVSIYNENDVIIIGGQSIYSQLLDYCSVAYITKIHQNIESADRFFPDIDQMDNWKLSEVSDRKLYNGISYSFCVYRNMAAKPNPYQANSQQQK